MTNPYNMQMVPQEYGYQTQYSNHGNSIGSVLGGATLGFAGGGTIGYFKNRYPVKKDGKVVDSFVKQVYEKVVDKCGGKELYTQTKNILSKIDKVKDPEAYRKLITENSDIFQSISKIIPVDTAKEVVNTTNLNAHKNTLKAALQSNIEHQKTLLKSTINMCWDSEKKKFVKPDGMQSEELFNIIKGTTNKAAYKKALKYGAIGAGILAGAVFILKLVAGSSMQKASQEILPQNQYPVI